ncbi:MAG: DUF6446 family protein [Pseudomonadota bacterium]
MSGRGLMIGGLVVLVAFTTALWWFQTRAFYEEIPATAIIQTPAGAIAVAGFSGIQASSSPLKLRACMTLDPADVSGLEFASDAEPLVAPRWFECFDAKSLSRAIDAGRAAAYALGPTEADGIDRMLAVYPDGRAFLWHQLAPKFANQ